jgi:hypothetical protein
MATASDRTGEIQLTNGLRHLLRDRPLYACRISGVRHDAGNKIGFLKACVYFALQRPELAAPLRAYLETLAVKADADPQVSDDDFGALLLVPALSDFALSAFALSAFDGALSVDPDSVFLVSPFDDVEGSALDLPLEA